MNSGLGQRIAGIARGQRGLLTRRQLRDLGVPAHVIDRWVVAGRLAVVHRGVYLLGGATLSVAARELAAVMAVGGDAALSHVSAAYVLLLLPYPARLATVHVTTARHSPSQRPGIAVHSSPLATTETLILDGVRVTSVDRTLLDLAALTDGRELERAVAQAVATKRTSLPRLRAYATRHRGRNGTGRLRSLVAAPTPPRFTRSEAEERLLALIRTSDELPDPLTNHPVDPYELDVYWPGAQLAVEYDSFEFHGDEAAFEHDRLRDARLAAEHGIQVLRVTRRQVFHNPSPLLIRLERTYRRRRRGR